MTATHHRIGTKCRRCDAMYVLHTGDERACPDGTGRTFQVEPRSRLRASLSLNAAEIVTLDRVVRNALHAGGTAPELLSLLRKARGMRQSVEQRAAVLATDPEAKAS